MLIKILVCLIFASLTRKLNTVALTCEFKSKEVEASNGNKFNAYGCELSSIQQSDIITGNHLQGKRDSDVTFVNVDRGQNDSMNLGPVFCQKFPNLRAFTVHREKILNIDRHSFINCKNLEELQFFENEIKEIPSDLLKGSIKLKTFAIESNKITQLYDFFSDQERLEKLSLHNNQITQLSTNIFKPLINLKHLSLSNNNLKFINPSWFTSFQKLERMSLNKNEILILPEVIFEYLISLKELYLTSNKIQAINPNWFVNVPKLEILGLDRNQIAQLKKDDLRSAVNLKGLYLNYNKIRELGQGCFDRLQNLEVLGLGWNEISDLPRNIFSSLTKLKDLGLNNNQLTTIHGDSFGAIKTLTTIYFGSNKINSIDERLINNTGVTKIDVLNNFCYSDWIFERTKIKENLRKCFGNYRSRPGQIIATTEATLKYTTTEDLSSTNTCGRSQVAVGNIIGGSKITRGEYPWIAALLNITGKYFCGGTLVSDQKVVTAAHCIQEKQSRGMLYPRDMKVILGSHDLDAKFELEARPVAVRDIHVHPEWNPQVEQYNSDIAVLVLAQKIDYTSYIQKICLDTSTYIGAINEGIVVGYGKSEDESKLHENIPKIIKLPIHNNGDCFLDYPSLARISSRKTFCAGSGDGTGVCLGDSGSGLVVKHGSAFYLRGVVSSSLRDYKYGCDVNTYSVFTDVLQFRDWINNIDELGDFYTSRVDVESGPVWT